MAEEFNNNLVAVAGNFLKKLNVPFTYSVFKKKLENNPYYPSLYSLSNILNEYNVENKGLQVEPEQLEELPVPFLAYYKIKGTGAKDFINVIAIAGNTITYYYNKEIAVTKEEFLNHWAEDTVFIGEKNERSKEKEYEKNKRAEFKNKSRTYWLLLGYGLFIVLALYNYIRVYDNIIESVSLLLFSLAGLTVSILLLVYEVDRSNVFVKSICTGGEKTNCDAVLGSKAARLFGISWAEVGFFYFSAFTLFLLLPVISFPEKIPYLSYASVLSAAYIPFSIYYQYKVVKQWCRLCLFIQATLLLNLVWAIGFGTFSLVPSYASIFLFTGTILAPIVIWYTLKPILLKAKDKNKYEAAYKRLYSRKDVFELTLGDRETAPDGWQHLGIHKGNHQAENIILKVCDPFCKYCLTSHAIFNDILKDNNNVRLVILYDINPDQQDNDRKLPVKHFLALAEQKNKKVMEEAMDYWYLNKNRNYDNLKEKYPLPDEMLLSQELKIDRMREWCRKAEISYTPTIYINGKQLPGTFNLEDLKDYFL